MSISRLKRLREAMREKGIDALIAQRPENRAYLSGFTGSAGVLVVTEQHAWLVTDFRYVEQATRQAPDFEVARAAATTYAVVAELVERSAVARVGFEGDFITFDEYGLYQQFLPGCELVPASGMVESLRMIKDEGEIALMRRAAAIGDEAFKHIQGYIKPGITEREIALELEFTMKRMGAEALSFETIAASGVRSSMPHGLASEKVVETGDLLTLDFGCIYEGYCSDMTRTVMIGQPDAKQREIYEIVLEAQLRGVAACRAGITGKDLDDVCRGYITEKGYGDSFGHGTGHGVGRYIHEGPKVSFRGEPEELKAGMVVTVEPGIYLPGWGGVRIEDTVLVTENGCERLTNSPKELIIL